MKAEGSIYLVLAVMLHIENPDVLFYPIMFSLKWLKPQSLLPMIKNRLVLKVLLLFTALKKKRRGNISSSYWL